MAVLLEHIWRLVLMLFLLGCSAFFSGSETAFFNISYSQIQSFRKSKNKLQNLTASILDNPRRLLTSILFGNMTVNVLFFALSSVLSVRVSQQISPWAGSAVAVTCFFCLLLTGEMLPKSIAYSNSRNFAITAAPVFYVLTRILSPVITILDFVIFEPVVRLLIGQASIQKSAQSLTISQLRMLLEYSRHEGHISASENQLMTEVLEFGLLKVRHVMVPRVDMPSCKITAGPQKAAAIMTAGNLKKIPVYVHSVDEMAGFVSLKDILLNPDKPLSKLVGAPHFVPEQKTVESLFEYLYQTSADTVFVVDEYGGITGMVSLEHVIDELLGPVESGTSSEPVHQTGPMQYRLSGALPIHDWAEMFGIDPAQTRLTTIGGFAVALLGRIPKSGDEVVFGNLRIKVESVKKHRIETLLLSLEPITETD